MKNSIISFCIILTTINLSFAQKQGEADTLVSSLNSGAYCELNGAYIDFFLSQYKGTNKKAFVISRLGKGESERLGNGRIKHLRKHLESYTKTDSNKIVFGRSYSKTKVGSLEFYLGGELFLIIEKSFNTIGCLTCCGDI